MIKEFYLKIKKKEVTSKRVFKNSVNSFNFGFEPKIDINNS